MIVVRTHHATCWKTCKSRQYEESGEGYLAPGRASPFGPPVHPVQSISTSNQNKRPLVIPERGVQQARQDAKAHRKRVVIYQLQVEPVPRRQVNNSKGHDYERGHQAAPLQTELQIAQE